MSKKTIKGVKTPSRRKFFKAAAVTSAAAAATIAMPNVAFGAPKTLKMQAAWPSGANIFFEMAGDYAKMVSDMSGGELKIDLQPVGSVVKTGEIGQAVSSGVLDMGHWVTAYWYGKNAAASLFGTGPSYGMSSQEVMGWMEYGGGRKLYNETLSKVGFDYIGFFHMPMPAQPFGWFKKNVTKVSDVKGMKYRTVGLDVYKGEPNLNSGYLKHKSAFILPHLGSATKETRTAMANLAIDNLNEFFKTGNCKNKVN